MAIIKDIIKENKRLYRLSKEISKLSDDNNIDTSAASSEPIFSNVKLIDKDEPAVISVLLNS